MPDPCSKKGRGGRSTGGPGEEDRLAELLKDLAETEALHFVHRKLQEGGDPLSIMKSCQEGMLQVGLLYEQGRYYLSGLIMAGEILREIVELLKPALGEHLPEGQAGSVLLGTVHGDIHDIGKNMAGMLLSCNGFVVHDLGVDVAPEVFVRQAQALRPHIVGLSGLLTVAYDAMRDTIRTLRASEDPEIARIPVIIGGSLLSEDVAEYVGTEHWTRDAMAGVRLCQRIRGLSSDSAT